MIQARGYSPTIGQLIVEGFSIFHYMEYFYVAIDRGE